MVKWCDFCIFQNQIFCYIKVSMVAFIYSDTHVSPQNINLKCLYVALHSLTDVTVFQIRERLLAWDELPCSSCPLLFHGIVGNNLQEGDSPSWFNAAEAFQVCPYVYQFTLSRLGKYLLWIVLYVINGLGSLISCLYQKHFH